MSEARVSKGRVVLAGGSGFLGRALAEAFARAGYEPVVLTRKVKKTRSRVRQVEWDGRTLGAWARELEGAAAVVNLAGRSVDCRHTPKHRREIVESRVHSVGAVGRAIAALYPAPNRATPFANFVSSPTQRDRNDHFDARVDHVLNDSSTLAFRYSFGDRALYEPFAGPTFAAVPGYGNDVARRGQNAMAAWTKVVGPAFVNDARVAFNRVAASVLQENRAASVNQRVGLPDLSPNPRDAGLSFITVTGFSPLGEEFNNPQNSVTNTYQFLDTATYTRGSHLFKFGADLRAVQQNAFRDVQARGLLQFTPFGSTGNSLADLLLGTRPGREHLDHLALHERGVDVEHDQPLAAPGQPGPLIFIQRAGPIAAAAWFPPRAPPGPGHCI